MSMKAVELEFIVYPQKNQDTTGHADGKAQQVDEGESFVLPKVTKSDVEVVFEHHCLNRDEWDKKG